MLQEKYIRENGSNYMMIESPEKPGDESYHVKMLLKNVVHKFLPIHIKNINNIQIYFYDISSKQPVSRIYEGRNIKRDDIINIVMYVSQMIDVVNEYLLDLDSVVLNARLMYMDIFDKSIYFAYYPYGQKDFGESLKELFEYILEHLDHNDKNAVILAYDIYQKILQNNYDLKNIIATNQKIANKDENSYENKSDNKDESKIIYKSESKDESKDTKINSHKNHIIESVLPEEVIDEREVFNKSFYYAYIILKGFLIGSILFIIFNILLPQYRIIKIGLLPGIIIILVCILTYKFIGYIYDNNKVYFTKLKNSKELIEYSVSLNEGQCPIKEEMVTDTCKQHTLDQGCSNDKIYTDKLWVEKEPEYAATQLLSDFLNANAPTKKCKLVTLEDSAETLEIQIEQFPFIIGSLSVNCDYSLNNKLISRMHIRISKDKDYNKVKIKDNNKDENDYYVEDLNSTNGSFVNDVRIEPNEKVSIRDGDILKLAIIQFRFEIR